MATKRKGQSLEVKAQVVHDVDIVDMYKAHTHHFLAVRVLRQNGMPVASCDPFSGIGLPKIVPWLSP